MPIPTQNLSRLPCFPLVNSIYYGLKTGYNRAFIIDGSTRDRILDEDPRSSDIIRPILRGRDIQRYRARWAGRWLIATHNGYGDVPLVHIDEYPAVRRHLDQFYEKLDKRYDKGSTPYNLRNCAYHGQFAEPKTLWIELAAQGRFAYDESGMFAEATAFMMTGDPSKYLCAILNSSLIRWFVQHRAPTSGMGVLRWKKVYIEDLPIPQVGAVRRELLTGLLDQILTAKHRNPSSNTSDLEKAIDQQVYQLYDLDTIEIRSLTA